MRPAIDRLALDELPVRKAADEGRHIRTGNIEQAPNLTLSNVRVRLDHHQHAGFSRSQTQN